MISGSTTLYRQLLEADLIDELVLMICPIALGKGKRLFASMTHPHAMRLANAETSATGVIIATYERAG